MQAVRLIREKRTGAGNRDADSGRADGREGRKSEGQEKTERRKMGQKERKALKLRGGIFETAPRVSKRPR